MKQIDKVFQLKLSNVSYVLDLKQGKVYEGIADKADCTLELCTEDFLGMATGKLNPQKLYFGGKLKISGDLMASQKLDFLQKVDPQKTLEAMKAAGYTPGGSAGATAPATSSPANSTSAAASASKASTSATPAKDPVARKVFAALGERLKTQPKLAAELGAVVTFNVKGPDSVWTLDASGNVPKIIEGSGPAAATFSISDDHLAELVKEGNVRDFYQRGKLRVDGDVRLAQRLGFLKGL